MKTVQQAASEYVASEGMTKDALAKELGFSRSAFFMKLRGDSEFSLGEAYRFAKRLGVTLEEFYAMAKAINEQRRV